MALFPCDRHLTRVPGPNHGTYVAVGYESSLERHYLRLCVSHSLELQERLHQFELDADGFTIGKNRRVPTCPTCLQPVDEVGRQLFVTHYPAKDERKDYWSQLHDECDLPPLLKPVTRSVTVAP